VLSRFDMAFQRLTARFLIPRGFILRVFLLAAIATAGVGLLAAPRAAAHDKQTIWNYDGGVYLETDGSLTSGICFRVAGHVTSGHFFDDLKRIDDKGVDTVFRRGKETITRFPDELLLTFTIFDLPCTSQLKVTGSRTYLTRAMVSDLRLSLFWKRGVELRPATGFKPTGFSVRPIFPFNPDAQDVPKRFEWFYELSVPSAGVPLTDSLVLVIREADGHLAARVAARM
jgi:hypothetical protein